MSVLLDRDPDELRALLADATEVTKGVRSATGFRLLSREIRELRGRPE